MKNIVVITTQRSGSTWLMQLLNNIADCKAYAEIFRPITSKKFNGDENLRPFMFYKEFKEKGGSVRDYLGELKESSKGSYAFKIMYNQILKYPESMIAITKDDYLILHLIRSDYSDIVISKEIAITTGSFHSESEIECDQLMIEPKEFLKQIRKISLQVNIMKKLLRYHPTPVLEVKYEDLKENTENVMMSIMKAANTEIDHSINLHTLWKKSNTKQPHMILKNYKDIRKLLLKKGYTIK